MRKTAYALSIASTVLCSILIIPLAWMIPMTIATKNTINDGKEHLALGIFHILVMGLFGIVSGILLLIPEEQNQVQQINQNQSQDQNQ